MLSFRRILEDEERGLWMRALRRGLWIISLLYGAALQIRILAYRTGLFKSYSLPAKVICIGNITTGGTGKTSFTAYLTRSLERRGKKVVVISRGYKRKTKGVLVVSDGDEIKLTREDAGDEPYLLAKLLKGIPIVVGEDRYSAGLFALEKFAPDLIVLDDGFQHLKLRRNVDLVLVDASNPFGNGHLLPRGILREPPEALKRADILCLARVDQAHRLREVKLQLKSINPRARIIECVHRPTSLRRIAGQEAELELLCGKRTLALSGIGNPRSFERTLADLGADVVARKRYPDHHPYTSEDLREAMEMAHRTEAELIVTTEKDAVRFPSGFTSEAPIMVLGVEIQITSGAEHIELLISPNSLDNLRK